MILDDRICELGEGAFWHPSQRQLFWFDILNGKLLTLGVDGPQEWQLPCMVSAMGYVGYYVVVIASERDVFLYSLDSQEILPLVSLEADKPENRSNDGRTDRQGGFWIGTMAKDAGNRKGKGAIYRLYKGTTRKLFPDISIPNGIAFSPAGDLAYFADTMAQKVWKVALDADGWPAGEPQLFLDLTAEGLNPDGATVDAEGNYWSAQWGAGRVACYSPAGQFLRAVEVPAPHSSCPAFGGKDMDTLYVTSALEEMTPEARAAHPEAGKTFYLLNVAKGLEEPKFLP